MNNSTQEEGFGTADEAVARAKPRLRKTLLRLGPAKQSAEAIVDKKPKTEGHAEVFKYICAQHDKWLASRESIIGRLGNVRLIAGVLLSILTLSFPVVIKDVEASHGLISRFLVALPLLTLVIAVYFVLLALLSVPRLIGQVDMALPGIADQQLKDVLANEDLDFRQVLVQLSHNYIASIEANKRYNKQAGQALEKAAKYLRFALFWTISFLGLTLAVYILVGWSLFVKLPAAPTQVKPTKDTPHVTVGPQPARSSKPSAPTGTTSPTKGLRLEPVNAR